MGGSGQERPFTIFGRQQAVSMGENDENMMKTDL